MIASLEALRDQTIADLTVGHTAEALMVQFSYSGIGVALIPKGTPSLYIDGRSNSILARAKCFLDARANPINHRRHHETNCCKSMDGGSLDRTAGCCRSHNKRT